LTGVWVEAEAVAVAEAEVECEQLEWAFLSDPCLMVMVALMVVVGWKDAW
jgi:hypothetical protein